MRMRIKRMDPWQAFTLRDAMDRLFWDTLGRAGMGGQGGYSDEQQVPINMFEMREGLMVVAPMPGLQADDVEVTVTDNALTLRGRRSPGQEDREYMVKEWDYGPYVRTVELPFPVDPDHIIATLDNGILTVNLRKSEAVLPRRIQVRRGGDHSKLTAPTRGSTEREEMGGGTQGTA